MGSTGRRRRIFSGAVAVASALVAAACGGGAAETTDAASTTIAPEASSSSTEPGWECPSAPAPGITEASLAHAGEDRRFAIDMPDRRDQPSALIVDIHEFGATIERQTASDRWSDTVDDGLVVLYPAGMPAEPDGPSVWSATLDDPGGRDDVGFIAAVIAEALDTACIDANRAHIVGFSMGATLTAAVACAHPDLVASAVTITGRFFAPSDRCDGDTEVPVLHIHGDADPIAPYADIRSVVEEWADLRRCRPDATVERIADDVRRESFVECSAPLTIVTIEDGGHQRPGDPTQLDPERFGPQASSVSTVGIAREWFERHSGRAKR